MSKNEARDLSDVISKNIASPKYDLEKPGVYGDSPDSAYSLRRPSDEWDAQVQHHISVSIPQAAGDGEVEHNIEKNTSSSDTRGISATTAPAGKDVHSCMQRDCSLKTKT